MQPFDDEIEYFTDGPYEVELPRIGNLKTTDAPTSLGDRRDDPPREHVGFGW